MATTLSYSLAQFIPLTKIVSADANTYFSDIKSRLNWAGGTDATTGLGDDNIQGIAASGGGLTRATKLKAGTANYVVINDSNGAMSQEAQLAISRGGLGTDFSSSLSSGPGNAVVVNSGGTAFTLGAPIQSTLTENFSGVVTSLTAGEAITALDAVCLDTHNGTGSNVYRVFQCKSGTANRRRNFLGFSQAAAAVTAGIYTYVTSGAGSGNFVTSNVCTTTLNGRTYVTNFTTDNATTLAAVATAIATDPDVLSASSNGTHTITVTSKGGLSLNLAGVVTSGATQPTITVTNTQAPVGANVNIQCFGPLSGFTSLTVGSNYYLDTAAGAITKSPADASPIFVGQAISSTVLFINANIANFQLGQPLTMIRSHGASSNAAANATQDSEHFNFSSWSAGITSTNGARWNTQVGQGSYNGFHHQLDGRNTSDTDTLLFQNYNKTSWASLTNRAAARSTGSTYPFNNFLYASMGANGGTEQTTNQKWNGASWSTLTAFGTAYQGQGSFNTNSLLDLMGGNNGAAANTQHATVNGSDTVGSATVVPASINVCAWSGNQTTSLGILAAAPSTSTSTVAYSWNGTSWSGALTATTAIEGGRGAVAGGGSNTTSQNMYVNGGASGSPTNGTFKYNGSTFASDTASTNTRTGGPTGSVI